MSEVLSIIPARGGSIGIPGKNLKDFCGKPLIEWAIETSLGSKLVTRTIVTTDSQEIASVAQKCGAEIPFMRPAELATSKVAMEPTLRHAIEHLKTKENYNPDYVCLMVVTNPLRSSEIVDACVRLAIEGDYDCVATVNEIPATHTPFWCLVERDGKPAFYYEKDMNSRFGQRQEFPENCFARNDLIYVFKPQNMMGDKPSLFGKGDNVKFVHTPAFYDGDINGPEEWVIAENLFKFLRSEQGKNVRFEAK